MKTLRHPATVITPLALFVALGGRAAWASRLISGSQIKNHSIATKKLTEKAVKALHGHRRQRGPEGATGPDGPAWLRGRSRIGRLLRLLPPAPEGWVRPAQELPAAMAALDELVERAEHDAAFRLQLRADPRRAVAAAGYEPSPFVVSRLCRLLEEV